MSDSFQDYRRRKDLTAECQVIWFKWDTSDEDLSDTEEDLAKLSSSTAYDISNHLEYVSFTKSLNSAAGQFTLRLDNSRDWKDHMKPGEWIIILMSQDGDLRQNTAEMGEEPPKSSFDVSDTFQLAPSQINKERVRAICYIERVATSVDQDSKGALNVVYEISGRDYGVIYEETELWFSFFQFDQLVVEALNNFILKVTTKDIKELLKITHDLFYSPNKVVTSFGDGAKALTSVAKQWLLPKELLRMIGQDPSGSSYYGNIPDVQKFDDTTIQIPITNPLSPLQGNAWSRLKEFSCQPLHELFPELSSEGKMQLIFRPIPWGVDTKGYGSLNHIQKFQEFASNDENKVVLPPIDLISYNVGEDNHNRYNHFFTSASTTLVLPQDNISLLKGQKSGAGHEFPYMIKPSVIRHGFRKMHVNINSFSVAFSKGGDSANGKVDPNALVQYNEVLMDYWRNAVFFETGSMRIYGNPEVRLGKVLDLGEDFPLNSNRLFYIEGYTDEFQVLGDGQMEWTQSLAITRGVEKNDLDLLSRQSGFSRREKPFTERADFVKRKK